MTIKSFVFTNDFKMVYEKSDRDTVSSINVFCDVGSICEPPNLKGVSHFIEHMCFKGTKQVPNPKDIFLTYDNIGAYVNAHTEKRYTCYLITCGNEYIESVIEMISDMMLNSTFNEEEFKKEEHVVIEENLRASNDPVSLLSDSLSQMVYKGSPYKNNIDTLRFHNEKFIYKDVLEFYKKFYIPSRMVFSITTSISFENIKKVLINSDFTKLNKDNYNNSKLCIVSPKLDLQTNMNLAMIKKIGLSTVHVGISFKVLSCDKYIIDLLTTVLSGPMSSRLFEILREENGLTYSSAIYTTYHRINGDFVIYTECDHNKIMHNGKKKGVLPLIIDLLNNIISDGITDEELKTAKNYTKGKMAISAENVGNGTTHNGISTLIFPDEPNIKYSNLYEKKYKTVSKKEVHAIIKKYIKLKGMSLSLVGSQLPNKKVVYATCQLMHK